MAPGKIKRIIKANRKIISDYRQGARTGGVRGGVAAAAGNVASSPLALLAQAVKKPSSLFWKGLTGNKTVLGINIGVASFLKQSQTFNTSITSILQIIGAIVDVAIAPFVIPLIVPFAKKMGSWVPKVSEYANKVAAEAIPKITAMAESVWNGEGNWLTKIMDILSGTLGILWEESGLQTWWSEQTGSLGLLLTLLEGFGKFVRANWRLIETAITLFAKAAVVIKDPLSKEAGNVYLEAGREALRFKMDPFGYLHNKFWADHDKNAEAAANTLPPAGTLNKDMLDRSWGLVMSAGNLASKVVMPGR